MLQFCLKQNVFLYAMIAAGIAGAWCLFWSNRFYVCAIRDLGRMDKPKSRWSVSLLEMCKKKTYPLANTRAFLRSRMFEGKAAGVSLPGLLRGSQNAAIAVLALTALSMWLLYQFSYDFERIIRDTAAGIAISAGLLFLRIALDFGGKEEILLNGWTDYLENELPARKQMMQQPSALYAGASSRSSREESSPKAEKEEKELFSDPEKEAQISQVREGIRQTAAAESRFSGVLSPEEEKLMREIIREYL